MYVEDRMMRGACQSNDETYRMLEGIWKGQQTRKVAQKPVAVPNRLAATRAPLTKQPKPSWAQISAGLELKRKQLALIGA